MNTIVTCRVPGTVNEYLSDSSCTCTYPPKAVLKKSVVERVQGLEAKVYICVSAERVRVQCVNVSG